jgi:hypothetical protein
LSQRTNIRVNPLKRNPSIRGGNEKQNGNRAKRVMLTPKGM